MNKSTIVCRETYSKERQYLILHTKTTIEIKEAKKWNQHGNLVDRNMAGNGYHGRCEHCGLALVTDLGYNSWKNTNCEIKKKKSTRINQKIAWTKFEKRAIKFTDEEALEHQQSLIYKQGWGTYNFHCLKTN